MNKIELKDVSYSYPGSDYAAVKNVSFCVDEGEYIAILGSNGSGKSTLARLLCGFLEPCSGVLEDQGLEAGIVFQSPRDQIIAATLERDTAFGPENIGCAKEEIEIRTRDCLSLVGLLECRADKTTMLSLGQKQKLAFAGILSLSPDLLVLDEAVSMVDPEMREIILDFLDTWHAQKKERTIIHITHDIGEALRASRIVAMKKGSVLFDGTRKVFCDYSELVSVLFGTSIESLRLKGFKDKGIALSFDKVSFSYSSLQGGQAFPKKGALHDFSVSFFKGSVTAVMGQSGSGKSTLLELAAGILSPQEGAIHTISSKPVLALQETESALFEQFVADDVAFGPRNQGLKGIALKDRVKKAMDMAGVPFSQYGERFSHALSGGEKRKIALAGIIAMDSDVYLFDEPTAGLDPHSRNQIMKMFEGLALKGKTVIFSTHRKEEGDFAHRCITVRDGELVEDTCSEYQYPMNRPTVSVLSEDTSLLSGLRNASKGLYCTKKSFVHSLRPYAKYFLFLPLFIASIAIQKNEILLGVVFLNLFYTLFAHYPLKKLFTTFLKFIPWVAFFAIIQFLLFPIKGGEPIYWSWKFISVSPSKVELIIAMFLHVAAVFPVLTTFMYSTDETEILDGLKFLCKPLDVIGIKTKAFSMTISLIFRFVPLLADEATQIIKVQIIRGGLKSVKGFFKRIKTLLPLFVPLILQTFKRAEALGDTLDARKF